MYNPLMVEIEGVEMLSLKQAAERLDVAYSTLRRQAKSGALRATMIADSYVVTAAEVERYRRENKGKTGPKPRKPKEGAE